MKVRRSKTEYVCVCVSERLQGMEIKRVEDLKHLGSESSERDCGKSRAGEGKCLMCDMSTSRNERQSGVGT